MHLDHFFDSLYPLPPDSKNRIKECIAEVHLPKGHILLRADVIEKSIYFIKKGIVRAYSNTPDNQITFWFGAEGDTALSMRSYVDNQKGYEDLELMEDCELFEIEVEKLRTLFEEDIHIANWGRKFAEKELIKTEERLISRQFRTATERYRELLRVNADLIRRVPLGCIASYLGITQVSLSRIRAEVK